MQARLCLHDFFDLVESEKKRAEVAHKAQFAEF